jgi:hypothetical protein
MTSIFADNTELPIVYTKRIIEATTKQTDSLGKLTFSSTSVPKSSGLSQFIVSTSRPKNAIIDDDNKEDKKGEAGASLRRELLKDNMHMLNQALALLETDDDSDSESESEDDDSLF